MLFAKIVKVTQMKAGKQSVISSKLILRILPNMLTPIKIKTGAVAADGMIKANGAKNKAKAKNKLVNTTVKPVLPPASTPALYSKYVVILGIPNNAPKLVATASTLKH